MMILSIFCIFIIQLIGADHFSSVRTLLPDQNFTSYRQFGEISAVDVDESGDVYIFHRGTNTWSAKSFNENNVYQQTKAGFIQQSSIVLLDSSGNLITETGKDLFYMPHGLTVDTVDNIWLTDVALHQVYKYGPIDKSKKEANLGEPLLVLGEHLVPGSDNKHFCKPTSVAIDSTTNDFFVADGYCNSRIMKFDETGKFLVSWGKPTILLSFLTLGQFNLNVPHSLSINQRDKQLFVADRENARIVVYSFDGKYITGIPVRQRTYAIAYSSVTENLYGVTGDTFTAPGSGFIFSMKYDNKTTNFAPANNFKNAHDVAVSPDAKHIYVVELNPYTVWRFTVPSSPKDSNDAQTSNAGVSPSEVKSVVPFDENELPQASAGPSLGANQLAVTIVTIIVLLAIFMIGCHMYRKREKTSSIEMRGLILSDDEERNL